MIYSLNFPHAVRPKQGDRAFHDPDAEPTKFPFKPVIVHKSRASVKRNAEAIRTYARRSAPLHLLTGPLEATLLLQYPWNKAHKDRSQPIPKGTNPDIDNLQKQVFDACESLFYRNDGQIWRLVVEKVFSGRHACHATFRECPNYTDTEVDELKARIVELERLLQEARR